MALQDLTDELRLELQVCHFPPGPSKWNKFEHRLFCFISKNWRGRPLTSYQVNVNLIGQKTSKTGLRRGELRQLRWGDLHLAAPQPYVQLRAENTKNRKADVLPLHPDLAALLKAMMPGHPGAWHDLP